MLRMHNYLLKILYFTCIKSITFRNLNLILHLIIKLKRFTNTGILQKLEEYEQDSFYGISSLETDPEARPPSENGYFNLC